MLFAQFLGFNIYFLERLFAKVSQVYKETNSQLLVGKGLGTELSGPSC